jgi:hypothetical protein
MPDLLTPTINVPAEREKLRTIANEMRAQIEERKRLTTLRGVRGLQSASCAGTNTEPPHTHGEHGNQGL